MACFRGTVITGFEDVAKQEVNKMGIRSSCIRGAVCFNAEIEFIPQCLQLRSIDNLFAVLYENPISELQSLDTEEALNQIKLTTEYVNWSLGIKCWQTAFARKIAGGPEGLEENMRKYINTGIPTVSDENSPRFRVTCNRAGDKNQHKFSSMDAARVMGAKLNNMFGWIPDMKHFDIEVILNIRSEMVFVMIALNSDSLFRRNIVAFGPTTMRSTMCYCMVSLCKPQRNQLILDPMCGGGSIPIEGSLAFPETIFVGGDHHDKAMERCYENSRNLTGKPDFLKWDALNLPLLDGSIDAIVTDLPFGKKLGSTIDNRIIYPKLLLEWHRVVHKGGRIVVMTHDKRSLENSLRSLEGKFKIINKLACNQGGLTTICLVLQTL